MRLAVVAGPPSAGKTAVVRQTIRTLLDRYRIAYLKIDVVRAFEDEELATEFGIPTRKVCSGDLCPDHAGVMVMRDAIAWAEEEGADLLVVESAGLCLRCSPYTTQGLGIVVLSAVSGTNTPLKMAAMLALADIAVVTRIDLVSQAEKEVFRERIREVNPDLDIVETNAVQGTGMRYLLRAIEDYPQITDPDTIVLRGAPPLGVCTLCIGKTEIGWQNHFGVVRRLEGADYLFRGD
ncbi:cobalamin biosynthesis protein [Methanoculleus sp. FWC-SCC3]|uniref:Cobalamin biosynthesis protein n=1 Tax=Methanoculleus methanifontis TaxID=2584086 RepID=A0ABT8M162_9EURY|nr:GTP-binding protein [Methanoculleus sp. FWC-SCC3]MDN7011852.1 cobalamin biosynthesis protein [Methanoculleus sp. FWC-SCC3]